MSTAHPGYTPLSGRHPLLAGPALTPCSHNHRATLTQGAQPKGPGLLTRHREQGLPCPVCGTQLPEALNCVLTLKEQEMQVTPRREGLRNVRPRGGLVYGRTHCSRSTTQMDTIPDFLEEEHHDVNGTPFSEHDLLTALSLSLGAKGCTRSP